MSNTNVATTERGRSEVAPDDASRKDSKAQRPAIPEVDIYEDAGGITLLADMPGVSRESLDVQLDGDTLAIAGGVNLQVPDGMRAMWAEVNAPRYRRTFTLSRELDTSRIEANLRDGVLSLRIPKQAHAQPRRISVQTG